MLADNMLQHAQMVLMLGLVPEKSSAGRHDVGSRVDAMPERHLPRENAIETPKAKRVPCDRSDFFLKRGPCLNLIEQLEQQDAEEDVRLVCRQVISIDDLPNQVLTDP